MRSQVLLQFKRIYNQLPWKTSQMRLSYLSCAQHDGHKQPSLWHTKLQLPLKEPRRTWSTSASLGYRERLLPGNVVQSDLPDIDIPVLPFNEFMFSKLDEHKDLPALSDFLTGRHYTYRDLKIKIIKVASALARLGYQKGDTILCFSLNQIDYSVLMLASSCLGVIFSAASPAFTSDELAIQIGSCEPKAIFAQAELAQIMKAAVNSEKVPNKPKDLFVYGEADGFHPFQNLLEDDGKAFPDVSIDPKEDLYLLPYSSGTTGLPKGVMLTHYNIVIKVAHLVPPLVLFLAKHPMVSNFDLSNLKEIICAAAPLGKGLTEEFKKRFTHGVALNQGFGMTELSPGANIDTGENVPSVGPLLCNTVAKIVDLDSRENLGPNKEGELWIKGPQVMKGYYNNQKATDEMVDSDGWLHTGDIGYYDEKGLFYISDRLKELIKYKGSQVAPAELEALLLGHEAVHDVAVVGMPDDMAGEVPCAFVVKKPNVDVAEEDLVKFVEEQVSSLKRLRGGVKFVHEIPRNPSGKTLRRLLKKA